MSDPKIKKNVPAGELNHLDILIEKNPPKPVEECEPYHLMRFEYLMGLLEEFLLTGDYFKLRKYVKEGGNIDKIATDMRTPEQ